MSYFNQLLDNKQGRKFLAEEELVTCVTERVFELLEEEGITQAELARRLNVKPPRISRMLSGNSNITLKTLAGIGHALDKEITISIGECAFTKMNEVEKRLTNIERRINYLAAFREIEDARNSTIKKIKAKAEHGKKSVASVAL